MSVESIDQIGETEHLIDGVLIVESIATVIGVLLDVFESGVELRL